MHGAPLLALWLSALQGPTAFAVTPESMDASVFLLPDPGQTIDTMIRPGETREYEFELSPGEFLQIVLDRRGPGLGARLLDATGRTLRENPAGLSQYGPEPMSLVGGTQQRFRFAIQAEAVNGRYSRFLLSSTRRRAAAQDLLCAKAEIALAEADALAIRQSVRYGALAARKYSDALRLYRKIGDRRGEASALYRLGHLDRDQSDFSQAIDRYTLAVAIARSSGDRFREAHVLEDMGYVYVMWGKDDEAAKCETEALSLFEDLKDRQGAADALNTMGIVLSHRTELDLALDSLQDALIASREVGDLRIETYVHENIGAVAERRGDLVEAIDCSSIALALEQETADTGEEASTLQMLSGVTYRLGDMQRSLHFMDRSLALLKESPNSAALGKGLHVMSVLYNNVGDYDLAIDTDQRALPLLHGGDPEWEAAALTGLGLAHYYRGEYATALDYYSRALAIQRAQGVSSRIYCSTLVSVARLHASLGDYATALDRLTEARDLTAKSHELAVEASALLHSGNVYRELRESEKALNLFEQALSTYRDIKMKAWAAEALNGIGNTRVDTGEYRGAVETFERALPIAREAGAVRIAAETLTGLGRARIGLEKPDEALPPLQQALGLFREIKLPIGEAVAWSELMRAFRDLDRPDLAIVCGKQAVNGYQEIRRGVRAIGKNAPLSFLRSKEPAYRELADLLISQGRLTEAQRVLDMLKEEEYLQFVRRDLRESVSLDSSIPLSSGEAALDQRYRGIADQLVSIGRERGALAAKPRLAPDEERRLSDLDVQLDVAERQFQSFLDQVAAEARKSRISEARVEQLVESQGLMEDLRELGPGVVAIYTLLTEDKYRVVLITPDVQLAREYPIRREALNRKVARFREALQNPEMDPLPGARDLYDVLVGPIAADLDAAGAQTLMWSLDGVLRYVPIAALHDGKQFMAERYGTVLFTPASHARLKDAPHRTWDGLGLGVSKARGSFPALPGVREELRSIFRAPDARTAAVLPGRILLDEGFTKISMRRALRERHPVVHIASHFQFSPGDETKSFLLLGNGDRLSLGEIKNTVNLFSGVELLTLSACNTALSGSGADGREVEGFGVLAQRQGAKAIIATLWPVSDESSTRLLMHRFYQLRVARPGITKVEALRQAQLDLLHGTEEKSSHGQYNERSFAHPFFWAPFVLIGNWK